MHLECQFLDLSVLLFLQVKKELEWDWDVAFGRIIKDVYDSAYFVIVGSVAPQVIIECFNLEFSLAYGHHLVLGYFVAALDFIL